LRSRGATSLRIESSRESALSDGIAGVAGVADVTPGSAGVAGTAGVARRSSPMAFAPDVPLAGDDAASVDDGSSRPVDDALLPAAPASPAGLPDGSVSGAAPPIVAEPSSDVDEEKALDDVPGVALPSVLPVASSRCEGTAGVAGVAGTADDVPGTAGVAGVAGTAGSARRASPSALPVLSESPSGAASRALEALDVPSAELSMLLPGGFVTEPP
jgi:hypothetical protein